MPEGSTPKSNVEVTSDHLSKWNKLIKFARERGYAGKVELDHDSKLRAKVFAEYNKAHPNDAISEAMVKPIQNEIQSYKQQALETIKAHPESYPGNPANFMKGISQVDGIFGQLTSAFEFPSHYLVDKQTKERQRLGFASAKTVEDFYRK